MRTPACCFDDRRRRGRQRGKPNGRRDRPTICSVARARLAAGAPRRRRLRRSAARAVTARMRTRSRDRACRRVRCRPGRVRRPTSRRPSGDQDLLRIAASAITVRYRASRRSRRRGREGPGRLSALLSLASRATRCGAPPATATRAVRRRVRDRHRQAQRGLRPRLSEEPEPGRAAPQAHARSSAGRRSCCRIPAELTAGQARAMSAALRRAAPHARADAAAMPRAPMTVVPAAAATPVRRRRPARATRRVREEVCPVATPRARRRRTPRSTRRADAATPEGRATQEAHAESDRPHQLAARRRASSYSNLPCRPRRPQSASPRRGSRRAHQ